MPPGVKSDVSPGLTAAPNLPFGVSRRGCGRLIHPEPLHHLPQRPRLIRGRRGRRRAFLDECRVLLRDLVHLRDRDAQLLNPIALFTRRLRDFTTMLVTRDAREVTRLFGNARVELHDRGELLHRRGRLAERGNLLPGALRQIQSVSPPRIASIDLSMPSLRPAVALGVEIGGERGAFRGGG
ncbi:hypothetical protein [Paraburkholderia sp. 40]|uniref:hypothetical protein n=1 Tax=Paraburkholderia sp. 40 TaxID=2991059 RepID=UPI003D1980C4